MIASDAPAGWRNGVAGSRHDRSRSAWPGSPPPPARTSRTGRRRWTPPTPSSAKRTGAATGARSGETGSRATSRSSSSPVTASPTSAAMRGGPVSSNVTAYAARTRPSPTRVERTQRTGTRAVPTAIASSTAASDPASGCWNGAGNGANEGIPNSETGYSSSPRCATVRPARTSAASADQRWRRRTASQPSATASAAHASGTAGAPSWTKAAIVRQATPVPATRLPNRCRRPCRCRNQPPTSRWAAAAMPTNVPRHGAMSPARTTNPPHSRNVAFARTRVALDGRRSSRLMRTSSPAAATMLTIQNPARATSACAGTGSPVSQLASCGAASTKASYGSQRHERNSATPVVPTRVTATKPRVSRFGGRTDERRRDQGGDEAVGGDHHAQLARTASTAAAIAATSAPSRPISGDTGRTGGSRPSG